MDGNMRTIYFDLLFKYQPIKTIREDPYIGYYEYKAHTHQTDKLTNESYIIDVL